MQDNEVWDVIIVGGGPAGLAGALYAARDRYKTLILEKNGLPGGYNRGETETALYDLEADIGERNDVAADYPDVVERLKALGDEAREDLGDRKQKGKGVRPVGRITDP